MTGTALSEASERRILGGNQHALPLEIFPSGLAYVALGHLHLAQCVGGPSVRYSGSPLPLSMAEVEYEHQVALVDIDVRGNQVAEWRPLRVPRHADLVRIGPLPLEQALVRIGDLPLRGDPRPAPFVEITVTLDAPDPTVRRRVEEVLRDRHARLVAVRVERVGSTEALGDGISGASLGDLDPVEVFRRRYAQQHDGDVPVDLMTAFEELLDGLSGDSVAEGAA
jgi:exonuclease SbcD